MSKNNNAPVAAGRNDNPICLSFDRPQFKTEGNKITCDLRYIIVNEPRAIYDSNCYMNSFVGVGIQRRQRRADLYSTATGVAVCSPDDAFDKKTGRRIAQARAEAAAYREAHAIVSKHLNNLRKSIDEAYQFMDKADSVIEHNKDFVEKIGAAVEKK